MPPRKILSKNMRFEVFKRDKFTCQYCGKKAPDVILNVVRIKDIAQGGSNNILNFATICVDCCNGLGNGSPNDETRCREIELQQAQREQLKFLLEWKTALAKAEEFAVAEIITYINSKISPFSLSEQGAADIKNLCQKFSHKQIIEAIDGASKKYIRYDLNGINKDSIELFIDKIGGFVVYQSLPLLQQKIVYIKGIAKRRFAYWSEKQGKSFIKTYIEALRDQNWSEDEIIEDLDTEVIPMTQKARTWTEWRDTLQQWICDIRAWESG